MSARLKERYADEIRPQLLERFGYSSVMQVPRLEKITLNMGVGEAKQTRRLLEAAVEQMAAIARPEALRSACAQVDRKLSSCAKACRWA